MKEFQIREHVRAVARHLGFRVEDIPASSDRKSPDFEIFCGDECTLAELKSRENEWNLTDEEREFGAKGGIIERNNRLSAHSTIAGTVDDAAEQLASYQSDKHAFRIVWYAAYGTFREVVATQIRATFLGDVTIHHNNFKDSLRAFFFNFNKFFPHREIIDGAVVSYFSAEEASAQLVLNPLSPRYEALKRSRLGESFSSGTLDPLKEEKAGEAVLLRADADRTSESTKLKYLADRYGLDNPFIIPMGHMAAIAFVPEGAEQPLPRAD